LSCLAGAMIQPWSKQDSSSFAWFDVGVFFFFVLVLPWIPTTHTTYDMAIAAAKQMKWWLTNHSTIYNLLRLHTFLHTCFCFSSNYLDRSLFILFRFNGNISKKRFRFWHQVFLYMILTRIEKMRHEWLQFWWIFVFLNNFEVM
jgi:hypothetical protein